MKIKDLSPDERPREKMRQRSVKALSNAELLAVLLGSGTGGKNVVDLAQELTASVGGRLTLLAAMPQERLVRQKGIGEARAATILAALELGRRCFEEVAVLDKRPLTSAEVVFQLMLPSLKNLDHEQCWALFLNHAGFLLTKELICSGTLEHTPIDCKRILRKAIEKQCSRIILVHNHPSGSPEPSQGDVMQTDILRRALGTVGIGLTDHIIVAEDSYYSFEAERCVTVR